MTREAAELIIKSNLHRLNDGTISFLFEAILSKIERGKKSEVATYWTVPDDILRTLLDELYNAWFNKWKNCNMTNDLWYEAVEQLAGITGQYNSFPVVIGLAEVLLKELEERNK